MLKISPTKTKFTGAAKTGEIFPLSAELPFMSPREIYESVEAPGSILLESIKGPDNIARYSFICAGPFMEFRVKNGSVRIVRNNKTVVTSDPPLKKLKELLSVYRVSRKKGIPPFAGGAVGMISYDFVHYLERLPKTAADDLDIPDAHFYLIDTVIAVDHKLQKTFLISCPAAEETIAGAGAPAANWGAFYDSASEKINDLYEKISRPRPGAPQSKGKSIGGSGIKIRHEMSKKKYMTIVKRAKE